IARARAEAALLHDPLTGLGNRRRFDRAMADLDAGILPRPITLLIIDIDRFKSINDTYAHTAGDVVIREIAAIIGRYCRTGALPIRFAGDEFAVFLNADGRRAAAVAEGIRAAVAGTRFGHLAPGTTVSVSIGVARLAAPMTAADLFHAADIRLYQA